MQCRDEGKDEAGKRNGYGEEISPLEGHDEHRKGGRDHYKKGDRKVRFAAKEDDPRGEIEQNEHGEGGERRIEEGLFLLLSP